VELSNGIIPSDPEQREAAIKNLRWFRDAPGGGVIVLKICFNKSMQIREFDLARELLARWEPLAPNKTEVLRSRVSLEMNSGAYGKALSLLDGMLKTDPGDEWALPLRQHVLRQIEALAKSSGLMGDR